jgi:hypothetical protein
MQTSGGKLARKSDKIAQTPMQDVSAEVTPSTKNSKRDQAHYKKSKQDKKKEFAIFLARDHVCQLRHGSVHQLTLLFKNGRTGGPT